MSTRRAVAAFLLLVGLAPLGVKPAAASDWTKRERLVEQAL
jgi:hypothetical protein